MLSYQSHNMMSYDLFKTRLYVPYATLVNELLDIEDKNSISWKEISTQTKRNKQYNESIKKDVNKNGMNSYPK